MIRKQDLLDRAAEWQLRPEIVEKDYLLGWVLAAIGAHDETKAYWILKGGTSLKKCYLETYRFSEDVDVSLLPAASYTEEAIHEILAGIAQTTSTRSGITMPTDHIAVRARRNRQGQLTFQGRLAYRGPLAIPSFPRVLFDITQHEPVMDTPCPRRPFHPYPDGLPAGATVLTYSLDEFLAEKLRALYERVRPRDLYDVVYLLENHPGAFDLGHVHELFHKKCAVKRLPVPSATSLLQVVRSTEELQIEWANMLAHQLSVLPRLEDLLHRLTEHLQWLDEPGAVPTEQRPASAPVPEGTLPVVPTGIHYWGGGLPVETIRFAGANRLLVECSYGGERCVVEPYALRRAATGTLLLSGWDQGRMQIIVFTISEMSEVRATDIAFPPRYRIEVVG